MLPGATVSFSTTGRSGRNERSVAMIHYSGSNSLQLPFALFGLGETPNFIEDLTVGAGYSVGDGMKNGNATLNLGIHQWSLLVPNSQVIVSLFPIDDASKYVILLTITVHSCFFYLISRAYRAAEMVYTPLLTCNIYTINTVQNPQHVTKAPS